MIPLTVNPKVLVLTNDNGQIVGVATNIAPDVQIVVTDNPHDFQDAARGMPFKTGKDYKGAWLP